MVFWVKGPVINVLDVGRCLLCSGERVVYGIPEGTIRTARPQLRLNIKGQKEPVSLGIPTITIIWTLLLVGSKEVLALSTVLVHSTRAQWSTQGLHYQ